jgi:hypothetical protein
VSHPSPPSHRYYGGINKKDAGATMAKQKTHSGQKTDFGKKTYYGVTSVESLLPMAARVCNTLGHGVNQVAIPFLLEIAAAETQMGTFPDGFKKDGFGLNQADKISIGPDLKGRIQETSRQAVLKEFGVDVFKFTPQDIENDPLNAFIQARCHFLPFKAVIPATLEGRARYWKRLYNTEAGDGTVEHYIKSANDWLYSGWLNPNADFSAPAPLEALTPLKANSQ